MYKSLQAGRAIAAIFVVLYHLGSVIQLKKTFGITEFFTLFSFGGNAGVEFFFVLSGFIIFSAHRDDISKPYKLKNYIKKRLIRIYPTYWVIYLLVFLLAIISPTLRNTVPHNIFVIITQFFLFPQDPIGRTNFISVAWSLQYEIIFYLFFAFLIFNKWLGIIIGSALLFIYANYAGSSSVSFPLSFLVAQGFILLFVMGMIVSLVCTAKKIDVNNPIIWVRIGAIMFIVLALDTISGKNLLRGHEVILYGLASSFMIFGLIKSEDNGQIIGGHSWLQILGNSSYALYLIHYPLISILCKLFVSIHLNNFGFIGATISFIIIFSLCLVSSVAFHLWVEKPTILYLRNRYISRG
jgi:peptidoglycan/LPS O-acetylase OafA/YrhL